MSKLLTTNLLASFFFALAVPATVAAQEQPKWFALRDHEIGSCWTALLIKVDGSYQHGFAQTAGGPYDTEEQALERRKALQETGACEPVGAANVP